MLHTTFNRLELAGARDRRSDFGDGYDRLATHLGGTTSYSKDILIPLAVVVKSNGLLDALWCLQATEEPFDTDVQPLLRGYLADILERLVSRTSAKTKRLLDDAVALLRSPDADADAIRTAQVAYYAAVRAADDADFDDADKSACASVVTAYEAAYFAARTADDADDAAIYAAAAYHDGHFTAYYTTLGGLGGVGDDDATNDDATNDSADSDAVTAVAYAAQAVAHATDATVTTNAITTDIRTAYAGFVAERKWQTERFLAALRGG